MTTSFVQIYRQFPTEDARSLERQLVNSHVQFGSAINNRTISTFQTDAIANGERWFPSTAQGNLRDGNRKVFQITVAGSYPHGLNTTPIKFTRIYGTFADNLGNSFPLPYVNVVAVNNQISLHVTSTNIVITAGGGTPPTMVSGLVVLEWI